MQMVFHPIEIEICRTVGKEPREVSTADVKSRQRYLVELVRGVNALPDDEYDELSDEALSWFDAAVEALTAHKRVPEFGSSVVGVPIDAYEPKLDMEAVPGVKSNEVDDVFLDDNSGVSVGGGIDSGVSTDSNGGEFDSDIVDDGSEGGSTSKSEPKPAESLRKPVVKKASGNVTAQKKILSAMKKAQMTRVKNRRKPSTRKMTASRRAREIVIRSFLRGELVSVESLATSLAESGFQLAKNSMEFVIYEVVQTLEVLEEFGAITPGEDK